MAEATMTQRTAYLVGFLSGLGTIAAFLLPAAILTGWQQSPVTAAALVIGIIAAVGVNAWLTTQIEGEVVVDEDRKSHRPLIAAHR
jgi:hypothetical protein